MLTADKKQEMINLYNARLVDQLFGNATEEELSGMKQMMELVLDDWDLSRLGKLENDIKNGKKWRFTGHYSFHFNPEKVKVKIKGKYLMAGSFQNPDTFTDRYNIEALLPLLRTGK